MVAIGEIAKAGQFVVIGVKTDATGVTKGDVCSFDTNGLLQVAPTAGSDGPYGVAKETKGASVACGIIVEGYVYVTADGAIKNNKFVIVSAATAGQVIVATHATVATTPTQTDVQAVQNELWRRVGVYISHEAEQLGTDVTAAADADVIIIKLGVSF